MGPASRRSLRRSHRAFPQLAKIAGQSDGKWSGEALPHRSNTSIVLDSVARKGDNLLGSQKLAGDYGVAIELTEQQRNLVQQCAGQPVELVDPQTHKVYVLIARDQGGQTSNPVEQRSEPVETGQYERKVAEGVRRSQEALRRDLPKLLENKRLRNRWIAYRGDERVGIARDSMTLQRECIKCGYKRDEYYIGWINPCELADEEQEEPRPWHSSFDDEPSETAENQ